MFPILGSFLIRFGQQTQRREEIDDLPELLWSVEKFLLHILGLTLCLKLSLLHTREVIRLSYVSTYVLSD